MILGTEAQRILDRPLVGQGILSQIENSGNISTYEPLTRESLWTTIMSMPASSQRMDPRPLIYGTSGQISDSDGNILYSTFSEGSTSDDQPLTPGTGGNSFTVTFDPFYLSSGRYHVWEHDSQTGDYRRGVDPWYHDPEQPKEEPFFLLAIKLKTNV